MQADHVIKKFLTALHGRGDVRDEDDLDAAADVTAYCVIYSHVSPAGLAYTLPYTHNKLDTNTRSTGIQWNPLQKRGPGFTCLHGLTPVPVLPITVTNLRFTLQLNSH